MLDSLMPGSEVNVWENLKKKKGKMYHDALQSAKTTKKYLVLM